MKRHTVEPIKSKLQLNKIDDYLKEKSLRDYTIWKVGLNSGLRVSDICRLNISDVIDKTHIEVIEKKTDKLKKFLVNDTLRKILNVYLKERLKDFKDEQELLGEPLFVGKCGGRLDRCQVYRFINRACKRSHINVHTGTHTMRKTFGYHHYQKFKDSIVLQKIFNHSSARITLRYIGIEQDEIDKTYANFEL